MLNHFINFQLKAADPTQRKEGYIRIIYILVKKS